MSKDHKGNDAATFKVALVIQEDSFPGATMRDGFNYLFKPEVVHVTECGTEIEYDLIDPDKFELLDVYTSDLTGQVVKLDDKSSSDRMTILHQNIRKQVTVVSVRAREKASGRTIGCDPQVTNDPPPV
ncbi:hypothetical protein [Dyella sp.]|uniref:hypothetical protein n=1 Tax=Dyella sp. TaxID=1869338 RepID=UPI002ED5F96B